MPRLLTLILLAALLTPQVTVLAQGSCPALIDEALSRVGTACAGLDRNNACYGYNAIDTVFTEPMPEHTFTQPGDRVPLIQVKSISPAAANVANGEYGVSVLNVQANLPNTLPGQSVRFILIGGQELENGVEPEDALLPSDAFVNATTVSQAQLRPTFDGATDLTTYITVPASSTVMLDAVSDDGQQVRAVFQERGGWMDRAALSPDTDLSSLPMIGPADMTPMQAFYLPVGETGSRGCSQAPAMLVVQGPEDHVIDIQVYDIAIRIQSSIILRLAGSGSNVRLELIVLDGLATIFPGTPRELIVPPGYLTSIDLDDVPSSLGIEGDADERAPIGNWSTPRVLSRGELQLLRVLGNLPANVLNYVLSIPQLVQASGVGGPIPRLIFANPRALAAVTRACEQGRLPANVCEMLIGP